MSILIEVELQAQTAIWLIGGTQESAELAMAIAHHSLPHVVTVTTESARSLYPPVSQRSVWVGPLHPSQLTEFLQTYKIGCILDASHPFAVKISTLAIEVAQTYQIPYLRYERPELNTPDPLVTEPLTNLGLAAARSTTPLHLDGIPTLLAGGYLMGQRVLLTIGYRSLPLFQSWHDRATLFARILPSPTALQAALAAGFTADRLIALRPPISMELEKALWQQWQISLVVTKASGSAGGEDIKRQVAVELGVPLIVIDRPPIEYPHQTSDLLTAVEFCIQSVRIQRQPFLHQNA